MVVPFPGMDSTEKEPPESFVRSLLVLSPNPLFVPRNDKTLSESKPLPLSLIINFFILELSLSQDFLCPLSLKSFFSQVSDPLFKLSKDCFLRHYEISFVKPNKQDPGQVDREGKLWALVGDRY